MLEATTYVSIDREDQRMSHFVGIGLVLGFLLPHSSTALLLVNPLLCLFYQCFKQNRGIYKYNWIVLVPIVFSLLINLPQGISTKSIASTLSILLYFICFPIVGKVKIPNAYFYFILVFILLSQIAYVFNITFVVRILETYFPVSEEDRAVIYMQRHVNVDNVLNYRLGGLYHNPNQCSRYLTFLLASFMVLNNEKPIRQLLPFVVVVYYAVLLTGSRSGFVLSSLVIIVYVFLNKSIPSLWRIIIVVASIAVFLVLALTGSGTFRAFNVVHGLEGSADKKMDTFNYYLLTERSGMKFLLGYVDVLRFNNSGATLRIMDSFDSDYGGIIFSYGFVGFITILIYFFTILSKVNRNDRVFFVLLLWMISSTIVTSFRALFLFMLLLSVIYSKNKKTVDL